MLYPSFLTKRDEVELCNSKWSPLAGSCGGTSFGRWTVTLRGTCIHCLPLILESLLSLGDRDLAAHTVHVHSAEKVHVSCIGVSRGEGCCLSSTTVIFCFKFFRIQTRSICVLTLYMYICTKGTQGVVCAHALSAVAFSRLHMLRWEIRQTSNRLQGNKNFLHK